MCGMTINRSTRETHLRTSRHACHRRHCTIQLHHPPRSTRNVPCCKNEYCLSNSMYSAVQYVVLPELVGAFD